SRVHAFQFKVSSQKCNGAAAKRPSLRFIKQLSRRLDVAPNLGAQRLKRGEFLFITKLLDELQFEFLSIQFTLEIQKVRFDAKLRSGIAQGRTKADVCDTSMPFRFRKAVNGVHSAGRRRQTRDINIGRRNSDLAAQSVATLHRAG